MNKTVEVGQLYHDIANERRGRAVGRYVKVVFVDPNLPFALIENTQTGRKTKISFDRLLTPCRYAEVYGSAHANPSPETVA